MGSPITSGNMLTPRNPFSRLLVLTILCLFFFIWTFNPTTSRHHGFHPHIVQLQPNGTRPHTKHRNCALNGTYLREVQKKYSLEDNIEYGRRYIRFHQQNIGRKSITKINKELFPDGFDVIDMHNPPSRTTCLPPLDVPVPMSSHPRNVDMSDLLFGISTTYKRLHDAKIGPMNEWAHWLTDGRGKSNGAGLVLRLIDATDDEIETSRRSMADLGIDVKIYPSDSSIEMAKRYLSLLPTLYKDTTRPQRKFLVMCDDDTFFPSPHALLRRLSAFDHNEELYIGTFSEDVNNIGRHGSQAFGGAGVFFTIPLAHKISALFEECSTPEKINESNTGWGPQGDILLRKCIYEHTEVRLSMMPELHQLDIMGDPSGFYESGLEPLSLHHFKGGIWHSAKPFAGAQITHACGEACFLQRFQTADDFIISNGYSAAFYPRGINFNVNQMERTFQSAPDDYGWNLDFMLGPGRDSLLASGRKVSWELKESEVRKDGSVMQIYVRKSNDWRWTEMDGEERYRMFDRDGIIELVWVP